VTPAPFVHPLRVRDAECDRQRIVFNANYFAYFDIAMTELWRAAMGRYAAMLERGVDMVVAEASARRASTTRSGSRADATATGVRERSLDRDHDRAQRDWRSRCGHASCWRRARRSRRHQTPNARKAGGRPAVSKTTELDDDQRCVSAPAGCLLVAKSERIRLPKTSPNFRAKALRVTGARASASGCWQSGGRFGAWRHG
jgi:hypothetical protein